MESVKVMEIIPGDVPRAKSWEKIMNDNQDYPMFHHGPIESDNIVDVSDTDIILIKMNEKPGVIKYSGYEGNHRLAYLVWRYGPEVRITNFQLNKMYVSPGVLDILKAKGCPDNYEDYIEKANSLIEREKLGVK
jgi:hypothetical protein